MLFGNVSFDVAAIMILCVVLLWYCIEKRIPLKSYKVYMILIINIMLACFMEILTELMAQNGFHDISFMLTLSLLVMALHPIPLMILYYIATLANVKIPKSYIVLVMTAIVVITGTNPVTKFCIDYSAEGYIFHWGSNILFAIDIINVLICLKIAFKLLKEIGLWRLIVLLISIVMCWSGLVIQIFWKQNMMVFFMALTGLSLYQYLQNPTAMTDTTTGLFNRKFMSIYVSNQFIENKAFEVIVLAMDDFKFINKNYGVVSGDELLKEVGCFLSSLLTDSITFRMNSDQFAVIVNRKKERDKVLTDIEERMKHPWNTSKHSDIMMSASICCISCPSDADDYEEFVDIMDYSVAVAKTTRKGNVSKVKDLDLTQHQEQKAIEQAVKKAMDNDEIMVHYQPIYSIQKERYNSAEALVRIQTEELGWISPEIFIPIAEKNGLINKMGEIILTKVCQFIRDFNIADSTIEYIEVNISAIQIAQKGFVEQVKNIMEKYDVKPQQINMEITETATMGAHKIIADNIAALIEYGISFSLDDYGSGNANIDYINQMPFSIIKLDKNIVWDSFKSEKAKITLEYTVAMLKALNLYIIAEGVETEEMKKELAQMGCNYMQGWYYSKAVPDLEFVKAIQR
ncbi:MAG: EAL domain-containing protein [Lachnospiraceae bacterium]|nr:EAL domain-containing protein [Lachnospiraceae bacterium]